MHFNFANEDEFDKIPFENQNARLLFEHYIINNLITDFYIFPDHQEEDEDVITEELALNYDCTGTSDGSVVTIFG